MRINIKADCKDGVIWFSPETKVITDFLVKNESNKHSLALMIKEMGLVGYPLASRDQFSRVDTLITEDELLVWVNDEMVIVESESDDYIKGDVLQEYELECFNDYEI
jgi:hypothetical protein